MRVFGKLRRIFYLVKKEFIEIFRQKELLPMLFIAPIIQVIVLGYVVQTDIRRVPVEIVNLSRSVHSRHMINRIRQSPLFRVVRESARDRDHAEVLKRGDIKAIILFRDSLDRVDGKTGKRMPLSYPQVRVSMDGIDANTSAIAAGYFNGIIRNYVLEDVGRTGFRQPVEGRTLIRFNPRLKSINYMAPGIVALLLTILTMFLTSVSIVREKEQQTMDTLLVSRLTPLEIYLGKGLPMALIGTVNMFIGIGVVVLWFRIPIRGNLWYLLLAAEVFLAAILAYALLISTLAGTQQQALFFSWFSIVTFILLSGLFTPTENIPAAFRFLVTINPLAYLVKIIREIFLKGNGIGYFYRDLLSLTAIALVIITVSLSTFRRFISK